MPVKDAIQLLKERKEELFDAETKQMQMELEHMIGSLDEHQVIQYVREEIIKRENTREQ